MHALLALEGVEATGVETGLGHGTLFHLEAGAGEPLVLLQGAGGGAANWYRLMGPLAANRRVLAPELPGFGLSDALVPRPPLGEQAAAVIADWLDVRVRPGPVDIIATSFGGLAALLLALSRPDRVGRLVLLNATGLGRGVALPVRFAGLPLVRRVVARPTRAGTARLFRALLTTDRSNLPPEHVDALVEYTWRSARGGAGPGVARALTWFAGVRGQREIVGAAELARIQAPALIVWGSADRFLPARHGLRAAAAMPHAEFRLLDGVGHSPNWESPAAVLSAVRPFLGLA